MKKLFEKILGNKFAFIALAIIVVLIVFYFILLLTR